MFIERAIDSLLGAGLETRRSMDFALCQVRVRRYGCAGSSSRIGLAASEMAQRKLLRRCAFNSQIPLSVPVRLSGSNYQSLVSLVRSYEASGLQELAYLYTQSLDPCRVDLSDLQLDFLLVRSWKLLHCLCTSSPESMTPGLMHPLDRLFSRTLWRTNPSTSRVLRLSISS